MRTEEGMSSARYVVDEKALGDDDPDDPYYKFQVGSGEAEAAPLCKESESAKRAKAQAGGYVKDVSCSELDFDQQPRRARYVQLRLLQPAFGKTTFAVRNILVLGLADGLADTSGKPNEGFAIDSSQGAIADLAAFSVSSAAPKRSVCFFVYGPRFWFC